jgi:ABC-type uncharacterized transport system YnjBCD permease subunit
MVLDDDVCQCLTCHIVLFMVLIVIQINSLTLIKSDNLLKKKCHKIFNYVALWIKNITHKCHLITGIQCLTFCVKNNSTINRTVWIHVLDTVW